MNHSEALFLLRLVRLLALAIMRTYREDTVAGSSIAAAVDEAAAQMAKRGPSAYDDVDALLSDVERRYR